MGVQMSNLQSYLNYKYPELKKLLLLADKKDPVSEQKKARLNAIITKKYVPQVKYDRNVRKEYLNYVTDDGYILNSKIYFPKENDNPKKRFIVLICGAEMTLNQRNDYETIANHYVVLTRLPVLVIDYRLTEVVAERIIEDIYTGLNWCVENIEKYNLNPKEIVLLGLSSGGGLAMSISLLAKKRGLKIKKQMLIYSMIDDATVNVNKNLEGKVSWTYEMNKELWSNYLGKRFRNPKISPILVPAHCNDFKGLQPTYIDVGSLDILCLENIQLARRLKVDKVPVVFNVYEGLPHGFETLGKSPYLTTIYSHRTAFLRQ